MSLGKKESPTVCVHHGVPQGSILGSLLFITFRYINDLPLHVASAEIDLYADGMTLSSATHYDNVDTLQSSLSTAISEVNQGAMAK